MAQSAPTIAAGTGPGVYINLAGTITIGVNPNTAITQAETDWSGAYSPWVRVNLTSATGTGQIYGVLYGWRTVPAIKTNVSGNTNVVGPAANGTPPVGNPVWIAYWDGTNLQAPIACTSQALFNLSGSGNTQIIAASGSTSVKICHIDFATTAPEDIKITQGTGANCVTGTADVTGLYKSIASMAQDYQSTALLRGNASQAICINQSAAQALGGIVIYAQF